jgi:glycine/D-amino acid oxidase-like deaminating enzyme
MKHDILWTHAPFDGPEQPHFVGHAEVDVVIVGGGIVGLTVANLLAGERSVAVLEARAIGTQVTGRSTAKATSQHGPIYRSLISEFGEAGARDYAEANEAAIGWIAGMADGGAEVCERAEAYVFAETETEAESLRAEAEVAARLGIRARFEPAGDLPFPALRRLAVAGQAQINPYLFLRGLARRLEGRARIHEQTRVTAVEHGAPCILRAERGSLYARWVIVATQIPTVPEGKFFARSPAGSITATSVGGTARGGGDVAAPRCNIGAHIGLAGGRQS